MKNKYKITLLLLFVIIQFSCKKDFLNAKPSKSLVVPESIADFQGLLDNVVGISMHKSPLIGQLGDDEWFTTDANWNSMAIIPQFQNAYIWNKEIFETGISSDWVSSYSQVFYANLALEGAKNIVATTEQEVADLNELTGGALFFRAKAFFNLLELFSKPFNASTESQDPGIPLRLNSDIQERVMRSTVKICYEQIIKDLKEASELLPDQVKVLTRPSKAAAFGLLARVYLIREEYQFALDNANTALNMNNQLMNYSELNSGDPFPFPLFNKEVILHNELGTLSYVQNSPLSFIDTTLYNSYGVNDYRKTLFFKPSTVAGMVNFKGTYTGNYTMFSGIATDELYLIKAECQARLDMVSPALQTVNTLIKTRWAPGTYVDYQTTDPEQALKFILDERRKELVFRGHRWYDLRRLNKDPRFAKTLKRTIEGVEYTLPPNDNRYVFPIPQQEIDMLGLEQNPR